VSDLVPIYGLGVAIAWASFVLGYYERTYRPRIEKGRDSLQRLGQQKLKKLTAHIETQTTQGVRVDSRTVESSLVDIRSLLTPQSVLSRYVLGLLSVLLLSAIASIGASYRPDLQVWMSPQGPITLLVIALVLLGVVFIVGFLFLRKVLWFENQVSKAETASHAEAKALVESEDAQYLRKLRRLAEDFHGLTVWVSVEQEDVRIVKMLDSVPYHSRASEAEVAIPYEQIHLYKHYISTANQLVRAWFDEHLTRLDFFVQNPGLLDRKNLVDLVKGFKRLVFEYYENVVEESIDFVNKSGVADKDAKVKFNNFRDRYNQFAERLRIFLKDLRDAGYDIGSGWEVRSISKELEIVSK
jgi:hypothetical protein